MALKYSRHAMTLVVFVATAGLIAAPVLAEDVTGNWFGAMDGYNLTFVHIEKAASGLSGFIDTHELPANPDNLNDHAALENLSVTPEQLTFHFVESKSSGTFSGRWDTAKKGWAGNVTLRDGRKVPLTLYRTPATTLATAKLPPPKEVDVEAVLNQLNAKSPQKLNWQTSIVDLMKLVGMDSSLQHRKELAAELGYKGDTNDSAAMNVWLHKAVMQKLAANGGKVPDTLKG